MTLTAMDGSALTSYIPGATQTWKLTSTTQYNFGFIAAAFSGSQSDIGIEFIASPRVGVLSPVDSSTQNMLDDGTNDVSGSSPQLCLARRCAPLRLALSLARAVHDGPHAHA